MAGSGGAKAPDFAHGFLAGHTAAVAPPAYSQAFLNAQPNAIQQMQMAALDAAKNAPAVATPAAAPAAATPAAAPAASPAAAPAPVSPLDFMRSVAASNPSLSLAQAPAITDMLSKVIPQITKPVPQTAKEKALEQYTDLANKYASITATNPLWATSDAGKSHFQLMENLRAGIAAANPVNDATTGMPPMDPNAPRPLG